MPLRAQAWESSDLGFKSGSPRQRPWTKSLTSPYQRPVAALTRYPRLHG